MIDAGVVGGAIIAVSACASGACIAIAYYVPEMLRHHDHPPAKEARPVREVDPKEQRL